MRVLIRVDASRAMGFGHVMRELALADELRSRGEHVAFVCRELDGLAATLVKSAGFSIQLLALPEECDEQHDAAATLRAASGAYDWIVVDDYRLSALWEDQARTIARKILAVDDLADRKHVCDLVVDQNLYQNADRRYDALVPARCERLLGPAYALLRPEFQAARSAAHVRSGSVDTLLVSFGGTDPARQTLLALEAILLVRHDRWAIDVVVGSGNSDLELIEAKVRRLKGATCRVAPQNMAQLMTRADLALGSGGVSSNERMCMGLAAAVVATSPLQVQSARDVERAGAHRYLGTFESMTAAVYAQALEEFIATPSLLRNMSAAGMRLVDGRGCERVADAMHAA